MSTGFISHQTRISGNFFLWKWQRTLAFYERWQPFSFSTSWATIRFSRMILLHEVSNKRLFYECMYIKNNYEYCTNEPCMTLCSSWLKLTLQTQAVWLTDLRFLNITDRPDCCCLFYHFSLVTCINKQGL
jgi:hypothetical protein